MLWFFCAENMHAGVSRCILAHSAFAEFVYVCEQVCVF